MKSPHVVSFLLFYTVFVVYSTHSCSRTVHVGWKACRPPKDPALGCESFLNVASLPTTALAVLLENRKISGLEHLSMDDIYFSTNMALPPDISMVGGDFYTLLYEFEIQPLNVSECDGAQNTTRQTLRFAGINYRARAWLNGVLLTNGREAPGMFMRRDFDVTIGGRFNLLVLPPDHPGRPMDGQGGDHSLAQDGAIAQFLLGWDWAQAMPDRSTGFFGPVTMEASGKVNLIDPAVQTVDIQCDFWKCDMVTLRMLARFEVVEDPGSAPFVLVVEADWGEKWEFVVENLREDIASGNTLVHFPEKVKLWWPHGLGLDSARLHSFTFTLLVDGYNASSRTIAAGIRTIDTFIDTTLQGQRFQINGNDLYLVGGNWITTDQAFRYSASKDRYCDEISLHRHAGLNLIRVWGGGVAEQDAFYDCADELGVLVFQEFWMTGDNNGRWAGSFSWPVDYRGYLSNVEDTIKRLRRHPSLLFYGGCNECLSPEGLFSPPLPIDSGIRALLKRFDPDRFYVPSSMGGVNKADSFLNPELSRNRSFSLSFADGPYRMLWPGEFFDRNPGLPFKNISIGFQPEIGSVSVPRINGLRKFMNASDVASGVPHRGSRFLGETAWEYHKFQPWTSDLFGDDSSYDFVYAYFSPLETNVTAAQWIAAAQLAAFDQYRSLFDGFISFSFIRTTAVIMWKSQSPWPSLRGFLYDWYLESSGTLDGVRAALGAPVNAVLDRKRWTIRIVNRRLLPLQQSGNQSLAVSFDWLDVHGRTCDSGSLFFSEAEFVASMSSIQIGHPLKWPSDCSRTCFLSIQLLNCDGCDTLSPVWYWLTDPSLEPASDFSALGDLRTRQTAEVNFTVEGCHLIAHAVHVTVSIDVDVNSPDLLMYPHFSVYSSDGTQLLPVIDLQSTDIVIVPGEKQFRKLVSSSRRQIYVGSDLVVAMDSWNAAVIRRRCTTQRLESVDASGFERE